VRFEKAIIISKIPGSSLFPQEISVPGLFQLKPAEFTKKRYPSVSQDSLKKINDKFPGT
jgi:hypothetical protein